MEEEEVSLEAAIPRLRSNDETLTSLNFKYVDIGDDGAKALADALTKNTTLKTLELGGNQIGADGAKALADALTKNTTLTTLILEDNKIGADGAKALADALTKNTTLTTLNLVNNKIGADGAKALADALTKKTTLTTLILEENEIGADGAKALADALTKNTTLTTLGLGGNGIFDVDGAKALADALTENATLTTLELGGNGIGADGAKALADALTKNTTLTTLNLDYNRIGADGAKALADALTKNTTLKTLELGGNQIGADGAKALADALTKNTTLKTLGLYANEIRNDGTKALADALTKNTTLTTLELGGNEIGADGAKALADALTKNTTLTTLNLVYNEIGADGAKALADALTKNTTLTTLGLVNNKIGADGAKALADALTKNTTLTTLNLVNNKIGADAAKALADALTKNTTLTTLNLVYNKIGADGAKALADALTKNTTLTTLGLDNNEIGADGAKALADALPESTTLTTLGLGYNEIGDDGAKSLAVALTKNTTLTTLEVNDNDIGDEELLKEIEKKLLLNKDASQKEIQGQRVSGDWANGDDMLDIKIEVIALAETLASKSLVPPFVLAILGPWGCGKSFDFNQIRQHLGEIMEFPVEGNPFVGHIYTINFDVWTYSKGDLWSSLMFTILSELNKQLQYEKYLEDILGEGTLKKGLNLIKIMDQLKTSDLKYLKEKGLTEDQQKMMEEIYAEKGLHISKVLADAVASSRDVDEKNLEEKKKKLCSLEASLEATMESRMIYTYIDRSTVVTAVDVGKKASKLLSLIKLGYDAYNEEKHDDELSDKESNGGERGNGSDDGNSKNYKAWPKNTKALIAKVDFRERYKLLFSAGEMSTSAMVFTVIMILVAIVLPFVLPVVIDKVDKTLTRVLSIVGPTTIAAINSLYSKVCDALNNVDEVMKGAREDALQNDQLLDMMEAGEHEETKKVVAEITSLKANISTIEERLWLVEGQPLEKVVSERLKSSGYEKNLGTVHQAKLDIQRISDSMLNEKNKTFPRKDPRIVLFVDDLDRCPPKKVVEMLEALQLLVKTKLFVVVVALDARYVTLCLEKEYEGILHANAKDKPTGLNYLEKIIQIPYRVPSISTEETMLAYLESQCNDDDDQKTESTNIITLRKDSSSIGGESQGTKSSNVSKPLAVPSQKNESSKDSQPEKDSSSNAGGSQDNTSYRKESNASQRSDKIIKVYQKQRLTKDELKTLAKVCYRFEINPRATKRILNCYKIMKIVWYRRGKSLDTDLKDAYMLLMAMGANLKFRPIIHNVLNSLQSEDLEGQTLGELVMKCIPKQHQRLAEKSCKKFISSYLDKIRLGTQQEGRRRYRLLHSFAFLGDRDVSQAQQSEQSSEQSEGSDNEKMDDRDKSS